MRPQTLAPIVVLADDLSGAAEVAGAAFDYGLSAEVQWEFAGSSTADVVVVDADTRGREPHEAARRVHQRVRQISGHAPQWMFKKVDSVLRGPVAAELAACLATAVWRRALLVPANPSRHRVVRQGRYFVDGQPLSKSVFAADPEHPRMHDEVTRLLVASGTAVSSLSVGEPLPAAGIAVGDAACQDDLRQWAACVDDATLAAGAVEFFQAMLAARVARRPAPSARRPESAAPPACAKTLVVCGSAAAWPARRRQCRTRGIPLLTLPAAPAESEAAREAAGDWQRRLDQYLDAAPLVVAAIGDVPPGGGAPQRQLVAQLANLVAPRLSADRIDRVCVEGGATAAALVRRLGCARMTVCGTYGPGIVALTLADSSQPAIVVKPGSYAWPESLWPQ